MARTPSTPRTGRRPPGGEVVLGVDAYRDVHAAAVVSSLGEVIGTGSFPATAVGYRELLMWVRGWARLGMTGMRDAAGEPVLPGRSGTTCASRPCSRPFGACPDQPYASAGVAGRVA